MKNVSLVIYGMGLSFILSACNSVEVSSDNEKNVGYFVTVLNESVDYSCENKRQKLNDSGKFECASFPISFYMESTKLGEISSIHKDGYVYPQDIIILEEQMPIYTSEDNMGFLPIEEGL